MTTLHNIDAATAAAIEFSYYEQCVEDLDHVQEQLIGNLLEFDDLVDFVQHVLYSNEAILLTNAIQRGVFGYTRAHIFLED